ncbi:hypothetical protein HTT03_09810 [Sulfitobacter sp. S0837]|uniref:hypothetical protein n=1 Tax=Sulfitobacter maritimus TaxID=2741719 RepID=UPI0015833F49|nr:hypothetical protein [Sulfitobacter maritimus]NUH63729.1 hypothetical protein [Sulfitobacter maritimus]NUH63797.1 hypothetical protein [Sulfitobacter maritimus]NUH65576.1 hypothetical protein [Sulfitobacter maritimus]
MKFALKLKRFARDEDGAVTVDWVVLTAAVVGLAVAVFSSIDTSATALKEQIVSDLNSVKKDTK